MEKVKLTDRVTLAMRAGNNDGGEKIPFSTNENRIHDPPHGGIIRAIRDLASSIELEPVSRVRTPRVWEVDRKHRLRHAPLLVYLTALPHLSKSNHHVVEQLHASGRNSPRLVQENALGWLSLSELIHLAGSKVDHVSR